MADLSTPTERDQRDMRLDQLIAESRQIIARAIWEHFENPGYEVTGKVILFSGGNDSTTLAHLFRDYATHAAHINTGIGIEQTRQFVRDTCAAWSLPLIERGPDEKDSYRNLVLDQGFPGPGQHFKMYQRLKERGLRKVRAEFVTNPRTQRVLYIAGRRRSESSRRTYIPEVERVGSTVWVSPLVRWTKFDLNTYRARYDVPRNEVSDLIHMSGECLCGAFAKPGELDEIGMWFPDVKAHIEALQVEVAAAGIRPDRCVWGRGGGAASRSGPMCSSCEFLFDMEVTA